MTDKQHLKLSFKISPNSDKQYYNCLFYRNQLNKCQATNSFFLLWKHLPSSVVQTAVLWSVFVFIYVSSSWDGLVSGVIGYTCWNKEALRCKRAGALPLQPHKVVSRGHSMTMVFLPLAQTQRGVTRLWRDGTWGLAEREMQSQHNHRAARGCKNMLIHAEQRVLVLVLHLRLHHPSAADLPSHCPQTEPAPAGLGEPQLLARVKLMLLWASLHALTKPGAPASF